MVHAGAGAGEVGQLSFIFIKKTLTYDTEPRK